ncbi:MAG TPA: HD domain-containing protein, partial [Patescibacteria group bacterium]|nr:HD domain-containing protein [Patescibacteria group bacterium]
EIQKSITFAIRVHETEAKKKRKGKDVPYITHPLAVGLILALATHDPDTIAAGILHDTIEDCVPYGSVTAAILATEFNEDIARIVNDVTEQDKSLPWAERKQAEFEHITVMKHDSQLVKSADVLHNLSELIDDIQIDGVAVLDKFNAGRDQTIHRYQKLIAELGRVWPANPLVGDLEIKLAALMRLL